jgi:hypothetical protein
MANDQFKDVKDEIRFFMDKSFQASFAYIGALVAAAYSVKLDVLSETSTLIGISSSVILSSILLLANFIFLTVNLGCIFAVIKRGIFIVASAERDSASSVAEWEVFLQLKAAGLGFVAWNTDNLYLTPIVMVVVLLSFLIFGLELLSGVKRIEVFVLTVPMALHLWPAWSLSQLLRLMAARARLFADFGPVRQTARLTRTGVRSEGTHAPTHDN